MYISGALLCASSWLLFIIIHGEFLCGAELVYVYACMYSTRVRLRIFKTVRPFVSPPATLAFRRRNYRSRYALCGDYITTSNIILYRRITIFTLGRRHIEFGVHCSCCFGGQNSIQYFTLCQS